MTVLERCPDCGRRRLLFPGGRCLDCRDKRVFHHQRKVSRDKFKHWLLAGPDAQESDR
jgi:hypothetical protein